MRESVRPMRRMLRVIGIFLAVVAAAVGLVLVYAATRPGTFRIERSILVDAPPEKIFPLIDDLHYWDRWSPQDEADATMKKTFSGSASGAGAVCDWKGTGQTGQGKMTITESTAPARVTVQVDWEKPFATRNINEFALDPEGGATKVTWSMRGKSLYILKVMSIFVNMDKMMGKHFEAGLKSLKSAAER